MSKNSQDEILLDRIRQLDDENKLLKDKLSKRRPFIDIEYIDKATKDIPSIDWNPVFGTMAVLGFAGICIYIMYSFITMHETGRFYVFHSKAYGCYQVYKEIDGFVDIEVGTCFKESDRAFKYAEDQMKANAALKVKFEEFEIKSKEILDTQNE